MSRVRRILLGSGPEAPLVSLLLGSAVAVPSTWIVSALRPAGVYYPWLVAVMILAAALVPPSLEGLPSSVAVVLPIALASTYASHSECSDTVAASGFCAPPRFTSLVFVALLIAGVVGPVGYAGGRALAGLQVRYSTPD